MVMRIVCKNCGYSVFLYSVMKYASFHGLFCPVCGRILIYKYKKKKPVIVRDADASKQVV